MPKCISPARKPPEPAVVLDAPTEWVVDVGDGPAVWDWEAGPPDVRVMARVRSPRSRARSRHVPVWAYATTTDAHLHLESGLEHDLLRELDRRPDVVWLVPQPCRLQLPLQRRRRRLAHVPDLLSLTADGQVTVWDARARTRQDAEFTLRADHTRRACAVVGWRYEVFTGLPPVRRLNLLWLHAYRQPMPWYEESLQLLADPASRRPATIGDVLAADDGSRELMAALWHGIWSGRISCDLDAAFRAATPIWLVETTVAW